MGLTNQEHADKAVAVMWADIAAFKGNSRQVPVRILQRKTYDRRLFM